MRYVLTRGDPPVNAILLVESGSRNLLERLLPTLRKTWGEEIFIDLVSCYPALPPGFRPETTRIYQLGMTVQVREAVEKSNEKAYGEKRLLRFYDVLPISETEEKEAVAK